MEEEMEVELFEVVEIDLDYEFEASRFFDFTREETDEEVYEAEVWFGTAKSYPPSPFVAEMFSMEKILSESVNVSPKLKCSDYQEQNQQDETFKGSYRGLTFYDHLSNDVKNLKTKPSIKPYLPRSSTLMKPTDYLPRSSTLMKPTASQIAKQNSRIHLGNSRFQKQQTNFNVPSGAEIPAPKRQKLEGGQLRKVGDMKQLNNLVHKVPKKDGNIPGVSHSRLKITVPVDPDFATASRTQRLVGTNKDGATGRASTFKARPLNRKILEAPTLPLSKKTTTRLPEFEVFRLKTMERAKQHSDSVRPTLLHQPHKGFKKPVADHIMDSRTKYGSRSNAVDTHTEDIHKAGNCFKARPLEKKIFASKGDMGAFRNSKPVTVPKEFNFQTDKRTQHNPFTELFGKLSIASDVQRKISAPPKFNRPSCISSKGSKENRGGIFQQDHHMKD